MDKSNRIILLRPEAFSFNPETAQSNKFQFEDSESDNKKIHNLAQSEFDSFVQLLSDHDIEYFILKEPEISALPDSVFLNNWFCFCDNSFILFPMESKTRRKERRSEILDQMNKWVENYKKLNLSRFENQGQFLEGTGSVVFDHKNKIAYCSASSRSNKEVFEQLCEIIKFKPIYFKSLDQNGYPIYHTNVLMSIGDKITILCEEVIDIKDKEMLIKELKSNDLEILRISEDQMNNFCANCLLVRNKKNEAIWLMSERAYLNFSDQQIEILSKDGKIVYSNIPTIEKYGGGSIRCMIAEYY